METFFIDSSAAFRRQGLTIASQTCKEYVHTQNMAQLTAPVVSWKSEITISFPNDDTIKGRKPEPGNCQLAWENPKKGVDYDVAVVVC